MVLPNKDTERAYLAGIIDGEGHIAAQVRRDGRQITFQIVVVNTSWELMEWLAPLGGTVRLAGLAGSNKRTKTMWKWVVTGLLNVQGVLHCVRPHLVIKGAQADRVLHLIAERIGAAEMDPTSEGGYVLHLCAPIATDVPAPGRWPPRESTPVNPVDSIQIR
jgi:hypothetical protein